MVKISSYLKKYWTAYLFAIVCMFIAIFLDMLSPQITRKIVNEIFGKNDMTGLTPLLLGLVAIGVGRAIFGYLKEFTFDKNSISIGADMRKDLFKHVQGLSIDYFEDTNTGELMARIKDDVDNIWRVLGFVGMLIIEVVVHVVSIIYCMFNISPILTIVPVVFMASCGAVAIILEKKLDKIFENISEENAVLTSVAEENLAGVRTVKAFAREEYEIKKFLSHNQKYYELNMTQSKTMVRYYPYFQFVSVLLPVTMTILGGAMVMNGKMDIGSLVAYVEYSRNCTWPMEMLGWLTNDLSSAIASRKKIKKIYDQCSTLKQSENPEILPQVDGEIEFSHVNFELEDTKILEDVSFKVEQGKTLGIMGATGSGKTSIVNLLQRFYDPNSGKISLDGVNIADMDVHQVRESSAVVMQDVFLFSDTIEENIKMGMRQSMPKEDVIKAAELAQAKDFIEEIDTSYETVIGERGVGLSGGQKQRISIARALSKKRPILVLDDSTSALDMETEHEIQKTLNEFDGVTKLIIAHRISAVRRADEIIYLEEGRIAERGTHEELLAKKGLYYQTYKAQYGQLPEELVS